MQQINDEFAQTSVKDYSGGLMGLIDGEGSVVSSAQEVGKKAISVQGSSERSNR